ncbi:hypothetical protein EJ110_NYTH00955 [Nymphaea thermarum]|nr:hypothetical protein EJ110_NYTH00955 [Nymphaea thermarum]
MASQEYVDKMEARKNYVNLWHSDLISTMQVDLPCTYFNRYYNGSGFPLIAVSRFGGKFFDLAIFINEIESASVENLSGPCVSYMLRKRALYGDMNRYVCCAGYMPCSGRCGESKCPEFCLFTEVLLCFGNSVASTRFLLQDQFNIQTTPCDNCIIGFMFCLQQLACIFSIIAMIVGSDEIQAASHALNCLSDSVYCTVCACMQTQHKIEMDKRDGKFGPPGPMAVPPVQQMSRLDQPLPPQAGYVAYPGQPAYPHYGYPPPQGYPPAGYPPAPAAGYPPPTAGYPPAPQPYSSQSYASQGYYSK